MLISILGFGSIWSRRADVSDRFRQRDAAYYNTTGVLVNGKIRNRPRIHGIVRLNGNSGFRPDLAFQSLYKVFDCEPPCTWLDTNKILFKTLLPRPAKPDSYLVAVTAEQSGGIDTHPSGIWLHSDAHLISFSEYADHQELLIVMPPFTWIRGRLGAFFLEPDAQKPWKARLVLSARV
jgi:hypothetical protein